MPDFLGLRTELGGFMCMMCACFRSRYSKLHSKATAIEAPGPLRVTSLLCHQESAFLSRLNRKRR
jgi:hypothetical protein